MVKGNKTQKTTIGIWVGEEETLVDEFDDQLGQYPQYSRSERVKDSMRMYLSIDDILAESALEFDREVEKRMWVRQAIYDHLRSEVESRASPSHGTESRSHE